MRVCDIPPLRRLKKVLVSASLKLVANDRSCSPVLLFKSRPYASSTLPSSLRHSSAFRSVCELAVRKRKTRWDLLNQILRTVRSVVLLSPSQPQRKHKIPTPWETRRKRMSCHWLAMLSVRCNPISHTEHKRPDASRGLIAPQQVTLCAKYRYTGE